MQSWNDRNRRADLIVVGGGLAGLMTAALVARAGRKVLVLERAGHPGGRAVTRVERGIHFNLGPHALYCRGQAFGLLRELRIPFTGRFPDARRGVLLDGGRSYAIPRGLGSALTSRMLTMREKARFLRLFATLPGIDARPFDGVALDDWIREAAGDGNLARLLRTLCRVSTYADDSSQLSAGAAIDQLKHAVEGNVWYLDGGWQVLVDGLRERAAEHGVELCTGSRAAVVRRHDNGVGVELASGEEWLASTAVLAIDPAGAVELLDMSADAPLARWAADCIPVRAAYLLRRIFDYEYKEIGEVLGKSEVNCRQLVSRAEEHIRRRRPRFEARSGEAERLTNAFLEACSSGDIKGLVELLASDAVLYSDGGGKAAAALTPIRGADRIARLFLGIFKKAPVGLEVRAVRVNGQPGLLALVHGQVIQVMTFDIIDHRIAACFVVRNPEKLAQVPG